MGEITGVGAADKKLDSRRRQLNVHKCCSATSFYHGEKNHYGFFYSSVQLDFTINLRIIFNRERI